MASRHNRVAGTVAFPAVRDLNQGRTAGIERALLRGEGPRPATSLKRSFRCSKQLRVLKRAGICKK